MPYSRPKSKFTGTVQRKLLYAGSKSEHEGFVIDDGNGSDIELHVAGDNPFENKALQPFVGKRISFEAYVSAPGSGPLKSALFIDKVSDITVLGPPGRPARPPQP